MNIKKEVYNFLNAWLEWNLAGATDDTFKKYYGLCDNLTVYAMSNHCGSGYPRKSRELRRCLADMLAEDNLDEVFPFCDMDTYGDEVRERLCHKNERRVEWVIQRVS